MDDINDLIYNELKEIREDLKSYMKETNERISALEEFKNKAMGMCVLVGGAIGYVFEYLKGKVM